ncbi:MAG: hypothetical protein IKB70_02530 [Bacilli bacterium]|nr:hypothetical protein [Bacilli bacterium]
MRKLFNIVFRGYRPSKARITSIPRSPYRDGRFKVSIHSVQRMNQRGITQGALHTNLHTKAIKTRVKRDNLGRPSYNRISQNKIVSSINPKNNTVTTVRRMHTKKFNKLKWR